MNETLHWESFYVIIGSSAAALTGLQFVVIALVTETQRKGSARQIDAFATPTIVHFCSVLLLSAILSAPWPTLSGADVSLGLCGGAGIAYASIVIRRTRAQMHSQAGYKPVFEDWLCHTILPMLAYASLLTASLTLGRYTAPSLFVVGGAALLLLFVGIHNAWDTVTYIAINHLQSVGAVSEEQE